MENHGILTIRISGQSQGKALAPDDYDIRELAAMLTNVEDILYPSKLYHSFTNLPNLLPTFKR